MAQIDFTFMDRYRNKMSDSEQEEVKHAICVYDFTLHISKENIVTKDDLIKIFKKHCKKWCFQLEIGEKTGAIHYQGRVSWGKKVRTPGAIKNFLPYKVFCRPTSSVNRDNMFYVMKDETRAEGPWSDTDPIPLYIPRDVRKVEKLREWQEILKTIVSGDEDRMIRYVYDPDGMNGKSTFTRWMMCMGLAEMIPYANDFKDIMRMVMDIPESKCYIFDLPRAINKDRLYGLYAGIEMAKTGYAFDDRYTFKRKIFDPPQIIIFSNRKPDMDMLSPDRWDLYTLNSVGLWKGIQDKPVNVTIEGNVQAAAMIQMFEDRKEQKAYEEWEASNN